jgi:hypothetical protein
VIPTGPTLDRVGVLWEVDARTGDVDIPMRVAWNRRIAWIAGTSVGCSCLSRSLLANSNPRLGRAGDCVVLGDSERGLGREGAALALETRSRAEQGTELSQVATTLL